MARFEKGESVYLEPQEPGRTAVQGRVVEDDGGGFVVVAVEGIGLLRLVREHVHADRRGLRAPVYQERPSVQWSPWAQKLGLRQP